VYPWNINLTFKDAGMMVTMKVTISQAAKVMNATPNGTSEFVAGLLTVQNLRDLLFLAIRSRTSKRSQSSG
jgi:hypothetical protein